MFIEYKTNSDDENERANAELGRSIGRQTFRHLVIRPTSSTRAIPVALHLDLEPLAAR